MFFKLKQLCQLSKDRGPLRRKFTATGQASEVIATQSQIEVIEEVRVVLQYIARIRPGSALRFHSTVRPRG